MRTSHGRALPASWRRCCVLVLPGALALGVFAFPQPAAAFTPYNCHDDTSIARTNTHGSPLNGTFGYANAPLNHENAYYYLNVYTATTCTPSVDGQVHLLVQVTANGIGDVPGAQCFSTTWGPPCDPSARLETGTALYDEMPAWGFEFKDASTGAILQPCAGGDGSGGNNCPSHPQPVSVAHGTDTATWRFDGAVLNHGYRVRIANQYDDVIWETARLDVVACSTCFPPVSLPVTLRGAAAGPVSSAHDLGALLARILSVFWRPAARP